MVKHKELCNINCEMQCAQFAKLPPNGCKAAVPHAAGTNSSPKYSWLKMVQMSFNCCDIRDI